MLFEQGATGRHVYVILEGSAKVARREADGGQAILTIRAVGDVVGDMAALDGKPRSATVTALTALLARCLIAEDFRRFIDSPGNASAFAQYTVARLREADDQRAELALLPVGVRLARRLMRIAEQQATDRVALTQGTIAQLVGASRNAVVEELMVLRAAGAVTTGRGIIEIRDMERLRRQALE